MDYICSCPFKHCFSIIWLLKSAWQPLTFLDMLLVLILTLVVCYWSPLVLLGNGLEDPAAAASAKDIAVALVEGMFVLAEFSYWQVYNRYTWYIHVIYGLFPLILCTSCGLFEGWCFLVIVAGYQNLSAKVNSFAITLTQFCSYYYRYTKSTPMNWRRCSTLSPARWYPVCLIPSYRAGTLLCWCNRIYTDRY